MSHTQPKGSTDSFTRNVLGAAKLYEIIKPRHRVQDLLEAPFFFQDLQHVFYVRSIQSTVYVPKFPSYGFGIMPSQIKDAVLAPIAVQPEDVVLPKEIVFPISLIQPGVTDQGPVEAFLTQSAYVHHAMSTAGTVPYGDKLIGPGGSLVLDGRYR